MVPMRGPARDGRRARTTRSAHNSDDETRPRRNPRKTNSSQRDTFNARLGPKTQRSEPARDRGTFPKALIKNDVAPRSNTPFAQPATKGPTSGAGSFQQRYQLLKKSREKERADAIANGFLADPDRPRTLAEAITPVGTCQDMCAEFERVERVVQNDVWAAEVDPSQQTDAIWKQLPDESRMVKKFRRAAAGIDEQLPSDLRPPQVLQRTVNYLFNTVIGEADSLASVHHFVWDRTRAIRNDFSIQQLTRIPDLRIAIDSYERIARFHIVSLHQLALAEKPYEKYDAQQEREQLDKTLLSLIQYYDDSRGRMQWPNEGEFRAYCIIFQIQDPAPNLEDRIQCWPEEIIHSPRVQRALGLYAAACNASESQGPLRPRARHPVAQANWRRFWRLVDSDEVSYTMACVAEIYFPYMRRMAINAIWMAYRQSNKQSLEWSLDELMDVLGLESEAEVHDLCEKFGFSIAEKQDGFSYLELNSVSGRSLPDPLIHQRKSGIVEAKRRGRHLPAVINGMSLRAARKAGMIDDAFNGDRRKQDENSLFVPESSPVSGSRKSSRKPDERSSGLPPQKSGIATETLDPFAPSFSPSTQTSPFSANNSAKPESANDFTWRPSQPIKFGSSVGHSSNATNTSTSDRPQSEIPQPQTTFPGTASKDTPQLGQPSGQRQQQQMNPTQEQFAATQNPFTSRQAQSLSFSISNQSTSSPPLASASDSSFNMAEDKPSTKSLFDRISRSTEPPPATLSSRPLNSLFPSTATNTGTTQSTVAPSNGIPSSFFPSENSQPLFPNASTASQLLSSNDSTLGATVDGALQLSSSTSSQKSHFLKQPSFPPHNPSHSGTSRPEPTSPLSQSEYAERPEDPQSVPSLTSHQTPADQSPTFSPKSTSSTGQPRKSSAQSLQQRAMHQAAEKAAKESQQSEQIEEMKERRSQTLDCLAKRMMLEPQGHLDQYVEHAIGNLVQATRDHHTASRFRISKIQIRYGRRWREICWGNRVARQGRERRSRRARDAEIRAQRARERDISAEMETFRKTRPHASSSSTPMLNGVWLPNPSSEGLDSTQKNSAKPISPEMLRSSMPPPITRPIRPSSGHSISLNGARSPVRDSRPFKLSSATGRPSSFASIIAHPSSSTNRKHSPFYGRSYDTTRSTYFKLKAMGLNPNDSTLFSQFLKEPSGANCATPQSIRPDQSSPSHSRKRSQAKFAESLADSGENGLEAPPSAKRVHTTPPMSRPQVSPTAQASVSPEAEEDEALFAAVRQARQAMSDSMSFFHEEIAKEESRSQSRQSSIVSHSPPEFPGVTVHPPHALTGNLRASAASLGSSRADREREPPPKYRNRVSKFLPRERYADALIHKNKETAAQAHNSPNTTQERNLHAGQANGDTGTSPLGYPQKINGGFGSLAGPMNSFPSSGSPPAGAFGQPNSFTPDGLKANSGPSCPSHFSGNVVLQSSSSELNGGSYNNKHNAKPKPRHSAYTNANSNPFALLDEDYADEDDADEDGEVSEDHGEESDHLANGDTKDDRETELDSGEEEGVVDTDQSGDYLFDEEGDRLEDDEDDDDDEDADDDIFSGDGAHERVNGNSAGKKQGKQSENKFGGKGGTSVDDAIEL